MIKLRMKNLMIEAAKCFSDGYSPFNTDWLSENEVTLDECMSLSEMIGTAVKSFALAGSKAQTALLIIDASDGRIDFASAYSSVNAKKGNP